MIKILAWLTRKFHPRGTERLLRLVYHPDKVRGFNAIIPYDGDLRIHINTASFIEWKLYFYGYHDPELVGLIKQHFKSGVFVDVGANIGVITLIAAKAAREVIAIEPIPGIARRLRQNCVLNQLNNVVVQECGLSDQNGKAVFFLPDEGAANRGIGSLYERHARGKQIEIEVRTLDSVLEGKNVDFIKIDTEGNDGRVILGALNTIKRCKPIILFEYDKSSWDMAGMELASILKVLKTYGYAIRSNAEEFQDILCMPEVRER